MILPGERKQEILPSHPNWPAAWERRKIRRLAAKFHSRLTIRHDPDPIQRNIWTPLPTISSVETASLRVRRTLG